MKKKLKPDTMCKCIICELCVIFLSKNVIINGEVHSYYNMLKNKMYFDYNYIT